MNNLSASNLIWLRKHFWSLNYGFSRVRNSHSGLFWKAYKTTYQTLLVGYIRSLDIRVQRPIIRKGLVRLDPKNTKLRWSIVTTRRKYYIPWPNSLQHLVGYSSLICWGFIIHECINGYCRRVRIQRQ